MNRINNNITSISRINSHSDFLKYSNQHFGNIAIDLKTYKAIFGPYCVDFITDGEYDNSVRAAKKNLTDYDLHSYKYNVNRYGFRGNWDLFELEENSLATFGCSFTFGVGCDDDSLWNNLLAKELNTYHYNFGVAGNSIESMAWLFSIVTRFLKFDKVIFLIPDFLRQYYCREIVNNNFIAFENFLPNFSFKSDPQKEAFRQNMLKISTDSYMQYKMIFNIDKILTIAEQHSITTYFSSWDYVAYDILLKSYGDRLNILPFFYENLGGTKARDGMHPGRVTHAKMAEKFANFIKEHNRTENK